MPTRSRAAIASTVTGTPAYCCRARPARDESDRKPLRPAPMPRFTYNIAATDGAARAGTIAMARGEIRTPAFMPVGTAATVKGMKPADVRGLGADIILGNTYHL